MRRVAWAVLALAVLAGMAGDAITTECKPPDYCSASLAIDPDPPMPEFTIDYKALDGMECTLLPSHGTTMSKACFSLGLNIETCSPEHTLYQLWCSPKKEKKPKLHDWQIETQPNAEPSPDDSKASCDTDIAGVAKMLVRYDKQLLKGGKDITGWRETLMNVVRYCED